MAVYVEIVVLSNLMIVGMVNGGSYAFSASSLNSWHRDWMHIAKLIKMHLLTPVFKHQVKRTVVGSGVGGWVGKGG